MKKQYSITGILFLTIFVIILALFLVIPDRNFSENENRVLTNSIDFSLDKLLIDGPGTAVEDYLSDQMPWRDRFQELSSDAKRLVGFREINGVYLADDGYLITRLTGEDIPGGQLHTNAKHLNKLFVSSSLPKERITIMPVPGADYVLADLLPEGAAVFNTDAAIERLASEFDGYNFTDLRQVLKECSANAQTFYRTDHHWTTAGAYAAYKAYASSADYPGGNDAELKTVNTEFHGSLYSKVLCSNIPYDSVQIPAKSGVDGVVVTIGNTTTDGCYDYSYLDRKDKYSVFFGGNYSNMKITTSLSNGRRLLVIKDSFANCFVPFLTEDFEEIDMVDLRYFTGSLNQLIQDNEITDILVLYELSNMLTDTNFSKIGG